MINSLLTVETWNSRIIGDRFRRFILFTSFWNLIYFFYHQSRSQSQTNQLVSNKENRQCTQTQMYLDNILNLGGPQFSRSQNVLYKRWKGTYSVFFVVNSCFKHEKIMGLLYISKLPQWSMKFWDFVIDFAKHKL